MVGFVPRSVQLHVPALVVVTLNASLGAHPPQVSAVPYTHLTLPTNRGGEDPAVPGP